MPLFSAGKLVACVASGHTAVSQGPNDVCKTPTPAGPVPLPYPNIALSATMGPGYTTKTLSMATPMWTKKGLRGAAGGPAEPADEGAVAEPREGDPARSARVDEGGERAVAGVGDVGAGRRDRRPRQSDCSDAREAPVHDVRRRAGGERLGAQLSHDREQPGAIHRRRRISSALPGRRDAGRPGDGDQGPGRQVARWPGGELQPGEPAELRPRRGLHRLRKLSGRKLRSREALSLNKTEPFAWSERRCLS